MTEWETKKLGEVCQFVRGPFGGSLKKDVFVNQGFAVYEQQHAIYDRFDEIRYFVDNTKFLQMQRFELRPSDLIMSCSGTIGRVAIAPKGIKRGIINQALLKMTPSPAVVPEFLKYWMTSSQFQTSLADQAGGAAIQNVASVSILKQIEMPVPPRPEQHRIVAILDEAFKGIATARANSERNLHNAREMFESHLEQVLSRRQGHWSESKLGDLCTVKTGKKDVNQGNPEGRFPFFTCAAEHTYSDSYSFDTEALLIAGNGNVGQVSYYFGKFEAYQRTYVLSGFKGVDARYIFRVLDKRLSAKVSKLKLGNTMPYIKVGMLTDFVVPVPSLAEQRRITDQLDAVAGEIERLESLYVAKSDVLIELKKSLLHQAFTGAL